MEIDVHSDVVKTFSKEIQCLKNLIKEEEEEGRGEEEEGRGE